MLHLQWVAQWIPAKIIQQAAQGQRICWRFILIYFKSSNEVHRCQLLNVHAGVVPSYPSLFSCLSMGWVLWERLFMIKLVKQFGRWNNLIIMYFNMKISIVQARQWCEMEISYHPYPSENPTLFTTCQHLKPWKQFWNNSKGEHIMH